MQEAKKQALRKAKLRAKHEAEEAKLHPFQPVLERSSGPSSADNSEADSMVRRCQVLRISFLHRHSSVNFRLRDYDAAV